MIRTVEETSPEPSVLIALNLARQHDRTAEQQILRQLKRKALENGTEFSTGTAAWYTMAVLSSCDDPVNVEADGEQLNLVMLLMSKLQTDIDNIDTHLWPLSDYYQVSLAVLALCKNSICLPSWTIEKIFDSAVEHSNQEGFTYPVDTLAVAALALRCVSFESQHHGTPKMKRALQNVIDRILANVQHDGVIGDLSTTGLAIQALSANHDLIPPESWDCQSSVERLLKGISNGMFENPLALSLVVPSLYNRTYLDIDTTNCLWDIDNLLLNARMGRVAIAPKTPSTIPTIPPSTLTFPTLTLPSLNITLPSPNLTLPSPNLTLTFPNLTLPSPNLTLPSPSSPTHDISVNYTVMDAVSNSFTHWQLLKVPLGSTVMDLMMEAQRVSPSRFSFDFLYTPWGPFITRIHGLAADFFSGRWLFFTGEHVLIHNLEDYQPSDGEQILAVFTFLII
ncbi:cobalamin binding intrinsic factor-like [Heterodontus francisci]|uniref:cobalamin binding intrinsic factor-like n=1 Tax=Heterodontus francisci TaxID=7792 RepID=UPI00355BFD67